MTVHKALACVTWECGELSHTSRHEQPAAGGREPAAPSPIPTVDHLRLKNNPDTHGAVAQGGVEITVAQVEDGLREMCCEKHWREDGPEDGPPIHCARL